MCSDTRKAITRSAFLVALWFLTAPVAAFAQEFKLGQGETSAEEFKLGAGQGVRVCVAVGERKAAFKFGTEAQLYVDYQPKDIAQAYIVDRSLWALGFKPGQTIVKVSRLEFRPALKRYEEVNTWFIVNVTEKPTTDNCLCDGRGERQCPGSPVTAGTSPGPEDQAKRKIAEALEQMRQPPRTGGREGSMPGDPTGTGKTTSSPTVSETEAAPKPGLDRPSSPQPAKPAPPQPAKPGPTVGQGVTGTRSSPIIPVPPGPPRRFDLPSPLPLPSPERAVGGGGGTPPVKKPAQVDIAKGGAGKKEAESTSPEVKGREPLTGSEMVLIDAGESTTAKFKKRVESVRLLTSDASVATVGYREGFGVTIKGNKPGRATVTVRGDIIRFEAGPGPVQQDIPFIFTYNVIVREAKGATGKPAKPRPNSFKENINLAVGQTSRISFDKKAIDLQLTNPPQGIAAATVANNVLTIKGLSSGPAVVTARFKIPDETGTPEAFVFTYVVKVGKLLPAYYQLLKCFTEESIRRLDRNIDTLAQTLAKVPEAQRARMQQGMTRSMQEIQERQRERLQRLNDLYRRYQSGSITEDKFFEELAKPQGMSREEYLRRISLADLRRGCPNPPAELAQSEPGSAAGQSSGSGVDSISTIVDSPVPSAGTGDDLSGGLPPPPLPTTKTGSKQGGAASPNR